MTRISLTKDMPELREAAKRKIDAEAEAQRLRYITPGSGQAMTYDEKYQDAVAFLTNPDVDPEDVGSIYDEVGITGDTAEEVALIVVGMRTSLRAYSRPIERRRLAAKKAIDEASNPAQIQAVLYEYGV